MKPPLPRREFLKVAPAVAAMLALSNRAAAAADEAGSGRKLGIAVVGLGNFAGFAMPRIQRSSRARITALVSGDRAKAERIAAEHGVGAANLFDYENFGRIADSAAIDAVYLCLPVGLHAEFAIRAMRAGKHVLSEKTLAADSAQAREMIRVSRETGRHLLVAYRTYFGPAYSTVNDLIRGGRYGGVVHVDVHKGFKITQPAGHWRFDRRLAGGGSLVDVGVYSVQAARLFAGGMPTHVTAQVYSPAEDPRFKEVEDTIGFTMRFPGGAIASGSSSWTYSLQNRLRVGLADGWLDLEPASPAMGQKLRIGTENPRRVDEPPIEQTDQMPLMFDHFADVVLDGRTPVIPATEGLMDLQIIEAIYKSAETGRTVPVDTTGLSTSA